ncbi:hypothetical protein ACHAPT_006476 [Fusarium lateritium]
MDGQVFNTHNISFMSSYFQAKKASNEQPVQILWNTILGTWFPLSGPYKLVVKSLSPASDDESGGIVIEVRFLDVGSFSGSDQPLESQIFMVECQGSDEDTDGGWQNAIAQLTHYLENNTNGSVQLFGAVAIGIKVELYEWEYRNRLSHLHRIHDGCLDLGNAGDRCSLEAAMDHIRAQGGAYAGNESGNA